MKTYRFWLLFLIAFCVFGVAEYVGIAHQIFFLRDVGYEPTTAATIYSVFGTAYVIGTLSSFLSDRLGRENVFIASCLLSAVGMSILLFMKDTSIVWMPFVFAVFFGTGLGIAGPVFFAVVADLFHGRYFGSICGTIILGFSLGGSLFPWLAGFLYDQTGNYLVTFIIVLSSLCISAILMWLVAPRKVRLVSSRAQY